MKIPTFALTDQHGKVRTDQEFRGKWLVVYFYPKDDTPGCTTEACSFRDGREVLESKGVEVVGVSKDSVKSHAKFAKKYGLEFTLLSDPDHSTIEAFGSWTKKKFMGREYMGINRDTYLINPEGEIVKKYEGVDPKTHFQEILSDLTSEQAA